MTRIGPSPYSFGESGMVLPQRRKFQCGARFDIPEIGNIVDSGNLQVICTVTIYPVAELRDGVPVTKGDDMGHIRWTGVFTQGFFFSGNRAAKRHRQGSDWKRHFHLFGLGRKKQDRSGWKNETPRIWHHRYPHQRRMDCHCRKKILTYPQFD